MKSAITKLLPVSVLASFFSTLTSCNIEEVVPEFKTMLRNTQSPPLAKKEGLVVSNLAPRNSFASSSSSTTSVSYNSIGKVKCPEYSDGYSKGFSDGFSAGYAVAMKAEKGMIGPGGRVIPAKSTSPPPNPYRSASSTLPDSDFGYTGFTAIEDDPDPVVIPQPERAPPKDTRASTSRSSGSRKYSRSRSSGSCRGGR